jgi:glycosyltransferase involved in cell wall biosynthesis
MRPGAEAPSLRGRRPSEPRITLIIPCYNDGATLLAAVESARRQEPCEIVVVDDGSTDVPTRELLGSFKADDIRVIRHEANRGLAEARDTGVQHSAGRFVFPLDADDELEPGSLTLLADALDSDRQLGLVWGPYRFFGEKSHVRAVAPFLDPWLITYASELPVSAMIRRDVLLQGGGWRDGAGGRQPWTQPYEDWNLWMSLAERGVRGRRVDVVVYRHRLHGTRMAATAISRYPELYAALHRRHDTLFLRRPETKRASPLPAPVKLALPVIFSMPYLSPYQRTLVASAFLQATVCSARPTAAVSRWLERRRRRRTGQMILC